MVVSVSEKGVYTRVQTVFIKKSHYAKYPAGITSALQPYKGTHYTMQQAEGKQVRQIGESGLNDKPGRKYKAALYFASDRGNIFPGKKKIMWQLPIA